jgi:hypothetical protein
VAPALTTGTFLTGYLFGLTLSNDGGDITNTLDIATGLAASDGVTPVLMTLGSALVKKTNVAWQVGTNQGCLDTGTVADGTYHVFLIQRSDTGVVDILTSLSVSAPTMPANYDRKRRVGAILRSAGAIRPFVQHGDDFYLSVRVQDYSVTNPGTTAVNRALSVPTGLSVTAFGNVQIAITTATLATIVCLLTDPAQTDSDPGAAGIGGTVTLTTTAASAVLQRALNYFRVPTNSSAQIRTRLSVSGSATILVGTTEGWTDTRGRI